MRLAFWLHTLWQKVRTVDGRTGNRNRIVVYPQFHVRRLEERRVLNAAPVLTGANALTTIQSERHQQQRHVGRRFDCRAGDRQ